MLAATANAADIKAVREQVEASMLLQGELVIETDGTVSAVTFKEGRDLSDDVANFVRNTATSWRFEPVLKDGKVVRARAPMSLRLVANELEKGNYEIRIRSASFDGRNPEAGTYGLKPIKLQPPKYPEAAFRNGVGGTAYLLLKLQRDGKVEQAHVEQVNLQVVASEAVMRSYRQQFADSLLRASAKSTFQPPSEGDQANKPYWIVRVPVTFSLGNRAGGDDVGKWVAYVPGPRERAPWDTQDEANGFSPDALPDGGVYLAEQTGPRLLTPLQGG